MAKTLREVFDEYEKQQLEKRADIALQALAAAYPKTVIPAAIITEDLANGITDLLADLQILCLLRGYDFEQHMQSARQHVRAELGCTDDCFEHVVLHLRLTDKKDLNELEQMRYGEGS